MAPVRVYFDCMVYDKIASDDVILAAIQAGIRDGRMKVRASIKLAEQLQRSPFGGVPDWFEVEVIPELLTVADQTYVDHSFFTDTGIFELHHGESTQDGNIEDAIIAESASGGADIFVTEDKRSLQPSRVRLMRCRVMTFEAFCVWLRRSARQV